MKYRHEIAAEAVEALTSEATDVQIAAAIAEYFIAHHRTFDSRVQLDINHNGKVSPCPLRIDRVMAKKCTVTLASGDAEAWINEALLRGYEVTTATTIGTETRSIAKVRSHIRHTADMESYYTRRREHPELDDEIPF